MVPAQMVIAAVMSVVVGVLSVIVACYIFMNWSRGKASETAPHKDGGAGSPAESVSRLTPEQLAKLPLQAQQMAKVMQMEPAEREEHMLQMAAINKANEERMRDAVAMGTQGNLMLDESGRMVFADDFALGGQTASFRWGQNEREVLLQAKAPEGTKARQVQLSTTHRKLTLSVCGKKVVEGLLFAHIVPDESHFELEDDDDGRLVNVTLTKAAKTTARQHWKSVIAGEDEIDVERFGPQILHVDPIAAQQAQQAKTSPISA